MLNRCPIEVKPDFEPLLPPVHYLYTQHAEIVDATGRLGKDAEGAFLALSSAMTSFGEAMGAAAVASVELSTLHRMMRRVRRESARDRAIASQVRHAERRALRRLAREMRLAAPLSIEKPPC